MANPKFLAGKTHHISEPNLTFLNPSLTSFSGHTSQAAAASKFFELCHLLFPPFLCPYWSLSFSTWPNFSAQLVLIAVLVWMMGGKRKDHDKLQTLSLTSRSCFYDFRSGIFLFFSAVMNLCGLEVDLFLVNWWLNKIDTGRKWM